MKFAPTSHPSMQALARAVMLASALGLSACATQRPAPPAPFSAPLAFKEDALWKKAAASVPSTAVPDAWWQLFKDPVLDDLQGQLVIGNQNLRAAMAQVASARAVVQASRAAMLPSLSVGAGASRDRKSVV